MNEFINKYFWMAAFFGWAVLLFVLSIIPTSGLIQKSNDEETFRWDYVEHFGVFVVLAILFGFWTRKIEYPRRKKQFIIFLIAGGLYAAVTELVQLFIETRSFNSIDLVLNLGGLLVGLLIVRIYVIK